MDNMRLWHFLVAGVLVSVGICALAQETSPPARARSDTSDYIDRAVKDYDQTVEHLKQIAFEENLDVPDATRMKAVEALGHLRARDAAEALVSHLHWDAARYEEHQPDNLVIYVRRELAPPGPALPVMKAIIDIGSPAVPHLLETIASVDEDSAESTLALDSLTSIVDPEAEKYLAQASLALLGLGPGGESTREMRIREASATLLEQKAESVDSPEQRHRLETAARFCRWDVTTTPGDIYTIECDPNGVPLNANPGD